MSDKRDEIIRTQMDVIETLISNNMRRIGDDFWGDNSKKINHPAHEQPVDPAKSRDINTNISGITEDASDAAEEEEALPKESIEDLKKELDELIGLDVVKKEVNDLINMVTVHKLREQHGLKQVDMSLHMVFSGNPGTGKTTIARIMSRVYHSLDILSKGHLIEVDRSGLVAGYVGQTATKTAKVIESAMGGVLFIDEAYALASKSENDFGQEAIDTILKAMEDHRDDLIVIVAGYDELMDTFIHSNPGLESRFNRFLHFEDYTTEELMGILDMRLKKGQYRLSEDAREAVRSYIIDANNDSNSFGNARGVRNIFEKLLIQHANRVSRFENPTVDDLTEIMLEDVEAARKSDVQLAKAEESRRKAEEAVNKSQKAIDTLSELLASEKRESPDFPDDIH